MTIVTVTYDNSNGYNSRGYVFDGLSGINLAVPFYFDGMRAEGSIVVAAPDRYVIQGSDNQMYNVGLNTFGGAGLTYHSGLAGVVTSWEYASPRTGNGFLMQGFSVPAETVASWMQNPDNGQSKLFLLGGDDSFTGGSGGDTLQGEGGDDTVSGGGGEDVLRGDDGNDSITGGAAFDDINGNRGNDTADGGAGDDWVVGGRDEDVLYGDDGGDIVYGNLGNDTCDGGAGADTVRGGQGDDSLAGGAGDDWLSGDLGGDTLSGGAGADVFHSFGGAGLDRVTDFNRAEGDRVQLDAGTTYTVSQAGADVVIDMAGGGRMELAGVSLASLTGGWISAA